MHTLLKLDQLHSVHTQIGDFLAKPFTESFDSHKDESPSMVRMTRVSI